MSTRTKWAAVIALWLVGAAVVLWIDRRDDRAEADRSAAASTAVSSRPAALRPEVIRTIDHDPTIYTQGFEVHDGKLFQSGGKYGESSVQVSEVSSGKVLAQNDLPEKQFGEGLTLGPDGVVQLTWKEGVARVLSPETLEQTDTFSYKGEGWGLCWDGTRYVMSDGSGTLTFRQPKTFDVVSTVKVTNDGLPATLLNELECVDGVVWANVYQSDKILRIDPGSGRVTGVVDAAPLVAKDNGDEPDVLNGIASVGDGVFWLTGKYWDHTYEVRFIE